MFTGGNNGSTRADNLKVSALVKMRELHRDTLERDSVDLFRKRRVPTSPAPRLVSAAKRYKGMRWLPSKLIAVDKLPSEAALPPGYIARYYATGKAVWTLYGKSPIDETLPWNPQSDWNSAFQKSDIAWGDPSDDETFVRLRLQGPNPFMLKAVDDAGIFELDFSNLFRGFFAPTVARFKVDEHSELGLRSVSIRIGDATYRPDGTDPDGWETAKRVVNALDARVSAFVRHLLNTHLMVGQAFAVAAYTLPTWHPLRPFMDFFTYGTLQVNHYAYDALLTPDSYFIRSKFLTIEDARLLINNAMAEFDFDQWLAPRDIAKRGIDKIPNHPYVEDARTIWPAIERVVERHLDDLKIFDDDIDEDPHLVAWYASLRQVIPDSGLARALKTRQDLEDLLTGLIYNNVIHEVCGNLAPILDSRDPADKAGINIAHLRSLADPDSETATPNAADVLLMDQASFVSTFNVAGNNLMTVNAARYVDDPRLREAIEELQATLRDLDKVLVERNNERTVPFKGMQPAMWEASISF